MTDTLSRAERSERMSRVKGKDSKAELMVRSLTHRLGYRFRLHGSNLPGKPDLVFASREKVIFVHGCFWHRHSRCALARLPKSRLAFWLPKLEKNRLRDRANQRSLKRLGWNYLVIWECELSNSDLIRSRISKFLGPRRKRTNR